MQSHNSLYTLFIVLMNVPTEPILHDAIGSTKSGLFAKHTIIFSCLKLKILPKSLCRGVDALLAVFFQN